MINIDNWTMDFVDGFHSKYFDSIRVLEYSSTRVADNCTVRYCNFQFNNLDSISTRVLEYSSGR